MVNAHLPNHFIVLHGSCILVLRLWVSKDLYLLYQVVVLLFGAASQSQVLSHSPLDDVCLVLSGAQQAKKKL